jgi:hypothetical protein
LGAATPLIEVSTPVTFSSFIWDPLRGKTSLSRVFWLYGVAGSAVYSVIGALFDVTNSLAMRIYVIGGLIFSIYVTVATYQCAGNCRSVLLARVVRVSCVLSLLLLPVLAYLGLSGALELTSLRGEQ